MADNITANVSFHWVKGISARTTGTSGAPLILMLSGHSDDQSPAEITIFTDNEVLTERLIAAINGVSADERNSEAA